MHSRAHSAWLFLSRVRGQAGGRVVCLLGRAFTFPPEHKSAHVKKRCILSGKKARRGHGNAFRRFELLPPRYSRPRIITGGKSLCHILFEGAAERVGCVKSIRERDIPLHSVWVNVVFQSIDHDADFVCEFFALHSRQFADPVLESI